MQDFDYRKFLEDIRIWYKSIKKVHSPALMTDVIFNAKGFYHILYDGKGNSRDIQEKINRLKLVRYAPFIIESAESVSWFRKTDDLEHLVFRKMVSINEEESILIRVIVRKTSIGSYYYHSVMDE